jgi:hypothetical protein
MDGKQNSAHASILSIVNAQNNGLLPAYKYHQLTDEAKTFLIASYFDDKTKAASIIHKNWDSIKHSTRYAGYNFYRKMRSMHCKRKAAGITNDISVLERTISEINEYHSLPSNCRRPLF